MQASRLFRFLLPLSLLTSGAAFSQLTTGIIEPAPNYDTMLPPNAGAAYVDPVFGSTIKRISNAPSMANNASGGNLTWIANEYSTMSPFNNDNSKFILVHESYFGLYNGAGLYQRDLPLEINSSSEPRWSRKDLVTLYYHSGNQIKTYNVSTGVVAVVHTFSEYSSIGGNGEMDISLDGDHLVYCGDHEFIFVYQISTDRKFAVFDAGPRYFDSLYITPANNVIVSWEVSGSTRYTGQELFDINMNFLRQAGHANGHKDVTVDTDGSEVLIWNNSDDAQPIPNCNNGIVKIRLANGAQTCLAQLDWSLAMHISAPDGNGTVFVDTEAPTNREPDTSGWVAYTDEILQVKLDGSGVTRWAHHRSRPVNGYNWEPKVTASRDGTRLLYASNFDLSAISGYPIEYTDTYLLAVGSPTPAAITWPAPAAITYGTALSATQLNASAGVAGTFAYTPGLGTILSAGNGQALSVTFTPNQPTNYTAVTTTTTINVNKATPTLTWHTPAAITFGGALGAGQLNATASATGIFVYTPSAGTVLPAGNGQTLSVAFTPADAVDYTTAAASTAISVNPAAPPVSPANLIVTRVLTRSGGNVVVQLTIANTGGTAAANVVIKSVTVGPDPGTPLPQSMGTIAAGASLQAIVTVPGSVGASGGASSFSIGGTYTGGVFSSGARITLP